MAKSYVSAYTSSLASMIAGIAFFSSVSATEISDYKSKEPFMMQNPSYYRTGNEDCFSSNISYAQNNIVPNIEDDEGLLMEYDFDAPKREESYDVVFVGYEDFNTFVSTDKTFEEFL